MRKYNLNIQDISKLYLSGKSTPEIAKQFGVNYNTILRGLREDGIEIRSPRKARLVSGYRKRADLKAKEIATLYKAGYSEPELAKKFRTARNVISSRLREAGVKKRTFSESNKLRMQRLSLLERQRLTAAAHAAVRGVTQSEKHRCKIATTRERNPSNVGRGERILAEKLRNYGLTIMLQKAIGRYNIDIAIHEGAIAVEIFGGHWHSTSRHVTRFRKRCDYLLDQGWLPVIIWVTKNFPLESKAVEYLVSLAKRRSSGESFGRQEHVIRGDGYIATGKHNPNSGTIIRS